MSFFNWRKLNFFDIVKVDGGDVVKNLGEENKITCTTSGRGNLILGDSNGYIWIYNRHWEWTSIHGWEEGSALQLVLPRQSNFLFGLGEEKGVRCLKVWDLERNNTLLRVSRVSISGKPTEPVRIAVSENLQLLAVGYDNGAICLHRGDATKEKGSKQRYLLEEGDVISGLYFTITSSATLLYLTTVKDVILFNVGIKDRETKLVLDPLGCQLGLSTPTVNFSDAHLITAQPDALYFYNPEGRGQCYVFEGRKKLVHWFRGYLSVAVDEGNGGNGGHSNGNGSANNKDSVTIFDVQNKVICFSAPVRSLFALEAEWGTILLIASDGRIIQLIEKDLQSKLDILFKKNFYDVAIKIARHQSLGKEGLVDIFRQYGDHLYDKGDHSGAIDQYEKTIGCLEPSYVIRRFLDTQKIHNLTAYLQALHRKGEATEDHTTLLLNCYTKLKDSTNLDAFIMTKDREVDFDVDIAINVCRKAGYFKHALSLAEKHNKHDLYLKIQLDDQKDYREALTYISKLSNEESEEQLKLYGSVLIDNLPDETTNILKSISSSNLSHPEVFIPLFIKSGERMRDYLEHVVDTAHVVTPQVWNTLLEYNLDVYKNSVEPQQRHQLERRIMELLQGDKSNYDPEQALVLCKLNHFPPGFLYLYQKCGLHEEILKYHFHEGNYEDGIIACRRFGPQNPNLWVSALQAVASSGVDVPQNYFKEVLENIEKNRLLSPLLVVTTLANCPTATLAVVRDYLVRTLKAEEESVQEDRKMIEEYRTSTHDLRKVIHSLKTESTVFQSTKCSACNNSLDLPTVHFLCQHGYHEHCFQSLADNDQECPKCSEENKKILDIIRAQDASRNKHDQFHAQLEKAEDGFSIVAEYFGRGLFSTPAVIPSVVAKTDGRRKPVGGPGHGISENMASIQSEARLRAGERGPQGFNSDSAPVQESEARHRLAAGRSSGTTEQSEGRIRAGMRGGAAVRQEQEARIRAGQASQVIDNVPSDARLRMNEGNKAQSRPENSLHSNLTRPRVDRYSPAENRKHVDLSRGRSPAESRRIMELNKDRISPQNPFGSPSGSDLLDENNPFASEVGNNPGSTSTKASTNPFGTPGPSPIKSGKPSATQPKSSDNPFGDDDDYNEELNPFAE